MENETLQSFLTIGIVGVGISALVEWIQAKFGISSGKTKALTITLSIVIGGLYFLFSDTTWYTSIVGMLAAASTVYALFINKGAK